MSNMLFTGRARGTVTSHCQCGDLQTPEGYEDVYNISGWTDKVIDFIFYAENEDEVISKIKEIKP